VGTLLNSGCADCKTRFWPETVDMHRIRLRDQFAGMALAGLTSNTACGGKPSAYAKDAYEQADAMLIQRDKKS